MPFLDANAINDDTDGLAFLAQVIGTADCTRMAAGRAFAFEPAQTGADRTCGVRTVQVEPIPELIGAEVH